MFIGGGSPVSVQSMTNTRTADAAKTAEQINALEKAGCDIVRCSVMTKEDAAAIYAIKSAVNVPVVADIHFNYRLAIEAVEAGADKIRINPGNIGSPDRIKAVCEACAAKSIPIRVGVNSGSLEKEILAKYSSPCAEALAESAIHNAMLLERYDFQDIVVSVKSSDISTMIKANRILAERTDYPLHLGVTEAGTETMGIVKSSVGIGSLLCDGIGDTIRVSLTENVLREAEAAINLLRACRIRKSVNVISCPTCGRTQVDLIPVVHELEEKIRSRFPDPPKSLDVAVMGCAVNGPGEAREADLGIAGGVGEFLLFRKGEIICKLSQDKATDAVLAEIEKAMAQDD